MNETPIERQDQSAWTKLRRRKVVQWGVAYAAGAWLLLQVLGFVADAFHWPDVTKQIATLALLVGLPIVLVLAWYHGDRGEQRLRSTELAILTMLLVVGGGLLWRYQQTREVESAAVSAVPVAEAPVATPIPDAKSIAVLPFVDMSAAKDQEYMSDGIAEELLNLLAKAPDLKVIARTSSFAFKGEKVPIEEIAKKLNVAHVLEGSVRTSGDKLRITAQLIRASDSTHLWSEAYDRPLKDIFAVQDEIANAIVQALQIKLMGGELDRRKGGTENLEAYKLYLRAWNGEGWNSRASLDRVESLLQQATALDPHFSVAWSGLAAVDFIRGENGYLDAAVAFERARQLAQHALQLSPDNAHAYSRLSLIHLTFDWDWKAAEAASRSALALDPTYPSVFVAAARLSVTLGRWQEAERLLRTALARDPLNAYALYNLGAAFHRSRRLAEAEAVFRELLALPHGLPFTRGVLGLTLLAQGKSKEALAVAQPMTDEAWRLVVLPILLQAEGQQAEADQALHSLVEEWADSGAFYVAMTYAYRGENDHAIEWLDRAYRQRDPALVELYGDPLFDSLAEDPRFSAFLQKMNLPPWPDAGTRRNDAT